MAHVRIRGSPGWVTARGDPPRPLLQASVMMALRPVLAIWLSLPSIAAAQHSRKRAPSQPLLHRQADTARGHVPTDRREQAEYGPKSHRTNPAGNPTSVSSTAGDRVPDRRLPRIHATVDEPEWQLCMGPPRATSRAEPSGAYGHWRRCREPADLPQRRATARAAVLRGATTNVRVCRTDVGSSRPSSLRARRCGADARS